MANNVSLKLEATDPWGNKTTTSISYVNPEASNLKLLQLAQKLNELTTNTYVSTSKVTTENIDGAAEQAG